MTNKRCQPAAGDGTDLQAKQEAGTIPWRVTEGSAEEETAEASAVATRPGLTCLSEQSG